MTYTLDFPVIELPGVFIHFPCDETGWVDEEAIQYHVWLSLQDCKAGHHLGYTIGAPSITKHDHLLKWHHFFKQPAN